MADTQNNWLKLLHANPEFAALCETYAVQGVEQARDFLHALRDVPPPLVARCPPDLNLHLEALIQQIDALCDGPQDQDPTPRFQIPASGVVIPKKGDLK